MPSTDNLIFSCVLSVLLLLFLFRHSAVESMIINIESQSDTRISARYQAWLRFLYTFTLIVLTLTLFCWISCSP